MPPQVGLPGPTPKQTPLRTPARAQLFRVSRASVTIDFELMSNAVYNLCKIAFDYFEHRTPAPSEGGMTPQVGLPGPTPKQTPLRTPARDKLSINVQDGFEDPNYAEYQQVGI